MIGLFQDSNNKESLLLHNLADRLILETKKLLGHAKSEEDLRIGFEKLLEPVLIALGIKPSPKYERSIYHAGRADALHGQVVIEYEPPYAFKSSKSVSHACDQLVSYLQGLSASEKEELFIFDFKFIGVGFDGESIFFVRYKGDIKKPKVELDQNDFVLSGPYDFDNNSARTLLTHLRALSRLPLTADNLAQKFGPQSEMAPKMVSALANALKNWGSERVQVFYNEWKRLFGIVYGEQLSGHQENEAQALAKLYKVESQTDFQELLFSVHTYFAFLMKIISAELLTLQESGLTSSLASELTHLAEDELKKKLADIEDGGIYARRGITNFLEGDFFRWYLDAWSPQLKEAIQDATRALSEFEPATSTLAPSATRDLLKKLYQYLVPPEVRHRLGEYYTPDWLAEFLLKEVGYKGNTLQRFLDPACGSGTFLVLAIQLAKEHGTKEKWPPLEIAKRIVANIWGFDLNPLAVIAARTNYLFALGELVHELQHIEIPIYLTDSVLTPTQVTGDMYDEFLEVNTSVGKFQVPVEWVTLNGYMLGIAAPLIEEMVKQQYSIDEAINRMTIKGLVTKHNEKLVRIFISKIFKLEKENKNGIWARFLKNCFAPMVAGRFDFVVGNPPWIRWGYLSQEYRQATVGLWKDYGLFSLKGHAARLGGGEKDFSMLFAYAAADYYLKDGAKLGFLITQEVFKSKGAGEGFRRFKLGEKANLKVLKAHDLVSVQPFEGAANKTAAIILRKCEPTVYPVPYTVWTRKKGAGKIPTDSSLEEARPFLKKEKLMAQPIGKPSGSWQTISVTQKDLGKIEGENAYQARRGASTEPYGVFWLELKQVLSDGNIIISNLSQRGKRKMRPEQEPVEPDLIFPAISGADINRWNAEPKIYLLVCQDPKTRTGYEIAAMKEKWPRTYGYLLKFKKELLDRAAYRKYHAEFDNPFYSQYNIADYTFSRYKTVWKRMANDLIAAVISQNKTPFGYKTVISTDTTSFFAVHDEKEAHYLCAIINSKPVRDFIKSYSSAGRGFGTPSVMQHVGIRQYNAKNPLHHQLAENSKKCHKLKSEGNEKEITKLEAQNDKLVMQLFGMKK